MKQIKKINRGWKLSSLLPLAGLLLAGMGLAGTAHAGPIILNPALPAQPVGHIALPGRLNLQSASKTFEHLKNTLERTNTGRENTMKHLQKEISARGQAVKQGTHMVKRINKSKQKIIRKIR